MYISILWFCTQVNVDVRMVLLVSSVTLLIKSYTGFLISFRAEKKGFWIIFYEVNKPQLKILDKDGTRKLESNFTD